MNHLYDLPRHQHLLLLRQADIDFLVGCNKLSEMGVTEMSIAGSTPPTKDVVRMRLFNIRGLGFFILLRRCS
jgi:hypothetical protein